MNNFCANGIEFPKISYTGIMNTLKSPPLNNSRSF